MRVFLVMIINTVMIAMIITFSIVFRSYLITTLSHYTLQ